MRPSIRSRLLAAIRRNGERVVVWVLAVLVVSAGGVSLYFAAGLHGSEVSIEAVRSADAVSVTYEDGVYALEPVGENATVGLVFYPGGRVDPDAYLATLAPLVSRAHVAVYVPEMPLDLAVLDPDAAGQVIAHHPEIDRWIVGGHSLGGAMACRYADERPQRVVGLLVFAAYCDVDVSSEGLAVLSVTGGADTVLNRETYRRNRANLPANATIVEITGMNHSQFGSYSGQRGDRPARIGYRKAHRRLASVVVAWIENRTGESTREIKSPRDGEETERTIGHDGQRRARSGAEGVFLSGERRGATMATEERNVLGTDLTTCSADPETGFLRDGKCRDLRRDPGRHEICAVMTADFLQYSKSQGNDLVTPRPGMGFPGLEAGDQWCVCVPRWIEAVEESVAPPVVLEATSEAVLEDVSTDALKEHAYSE